MAQVPDTETALSELDKVTRRIATLQVEKQVLRDHDDPESHARLEEIYAEMSALHSALVSHRHFTPLHQLRILLHNSIEYFD